MASSSFPALLSGTRRLQAAPSLISTVNMSARRIAGSGSRISSRHRRRDCSHHHCPAERKMQSYLADDKNFPSFAIQLKGLGLQLRDIPADGNCLFRALGDQLEGHSRNHYVHRLKVVEYMDKNAKDFAPFIEDNQKYENYLLHLKKMGTYGDNDAIVAFARRYKVHIVIHQLNSPFLLIQGHHPSSNAIQLHIAYHNGDHYSSVRWLNDNTVSPAQVRLKVLSDDGKKMESNFDEEFGVARIIRNTTAIEDEVIGATGFQNREFVQLALLESGYDVDAAIVNLFQMLELSGAHESGIWSEDGTGTRVFGKETEDFGQQSRSKNNHVHFREDSISKSSGYGSMNSSNGVWPLNSSSKQKIKKLERHRQRVMKMHQTPIDDGPKGKVAVARGTLARV